MNRIITEAPAVGFAIGIVTGLIIGVAIGGGIAVRAFFNPWAKGYFDGKKVGELSERYLKDGRNKDITSGESIFELMSRAGYKSADLV